MPTQDEVMSFWTMGLNQHTRGVWCNHLVYNLHLLTGKIASPGNSPFSLTGQPSACGSSAESSAERSVASGSAHARSPDRRGASFAGVRTDLAAQRQVLALAAG